MFSFLFFCIGLYFGYKFKDWLRSIKESIRTAFNYENSDV